jgi:hypothetical protein
MLFALLSIAITLLFTAFDEDNLITHLPEVSTPDWSGVVY